MKSSLNVCEYSPCSKYLMRNKESSADFIATLILSYTIKEGEAQGLKPPLMDLVDLQQMGIKVRMKNTSKFNFICLSWFYEI